MEKIKKLINENIEKLQNYFSSDSNIESAAAAEQKQNINKLLLLGVVVIAALGVFKFLGSKEASKKILEDDIINEDYKTIEFGSDSTSADVKWRDFLEEGLEQEVGERKEQVSLLQQALEQSKENTKSELDNDLIELKSRLSFALSEIDRLKIANENIQNDISEVRGSEQEEMPADLSITSILNDVHTREPVSSYNYLPATSYVSGNLLGGISVSTSVNTASEPIPVIIKLTGSGNLPKDFAVDIKQCRILASAYGDISSERAIIRAEELVCEDKDEGLITSTKVAGIIYGDDGANGIRGTVISMSDKHLKNAAIGGVLSGFSSSAKGQGAFNLTSLGAVSTKERGIKDMGKDGLLEGTSTAAEKLADYHIKLAENISPVILVPGGTKVDVVFTKSVEIGTVDVRESIEIERGASSK